MITVTFVPREGEPDKAVVDGVEFKANEAFQLPENRRELAEKLATNASFKVAMDPPVYPATEPGAEAAPVQTPVPPVEEEVYDDSDEDEDEPDPAKKKKKGRR